MIQIYTGDGKGKTTAATGLVIRALGAGLSPAILRFIKKIKSSENKILKELGVPIQFFGTGFIINDIPDEAKEMAETGLKKTEEIIENGIYELLILDEINVAVNIGLLSEKRVLQLLEMIPEKMEVILTGRGATDKMIEKADLVTKMKEIKHYYKKGIKARKGIEF